MTDAARHGGAGAGAGGQGSGGRNVHLLELLPGERVEDDLDEAMKQFPARPAHRCPQLGMGEALVIHRAGARCTNGGCKYGVVALNTFASFRIALLYTAWTGAVRVVVQQCT